MRSKKNSLQLVVLISFCNLILYSQQSILLNQSAYNLYVLCPAALGLNNNININCHYKKNWLGLNGSPELLQVTIDGSSNIKNTGLGLNISNEKAGIFSKTSFLGSFNYRIKISRIHFIYFGLSTGFQKQQSDFSKIKADAPEEFAEWPQQQSVVIPDASFGMVYSFRQLFISVSTLQLLQNNFSYKSASLDQELSFKNLAQFVFSIQNTFILKPDYWSYMPHLTLRSTRGLPIQYDLLNTLIYKNKMLVGIGYRNHYAIYSNLGFYINEKLRITYSYEYSIGIHSSVKGGHEIGLCFGFLNKKSRKNTSEDEFDENKLTELYEQIDQQNQKTEQMSTKIDSLYNNIDQLRIEMETLKNKQIKENELKELIQTGLTKKESENEPVNNTRSKTNDRTTEEKYKVISPKTETDFENITDSTKSNYKIVLGVYQLLNYAKEYQKFLRRELDMETKLVQLEGHPKKYIYVCELIEYSDLRQALLNLKRVRKKTYSDSSKVTNGDAWILQTVIK